MQQGVFMPEKTMSPDKNLRGFTLIEVMVVVLIIGILATIVVINVSPRLGEGAMAKIKNDLSTIESALELYKMDNYRYPTSDQGLIALVSKPTEMSENSNWKQYIKRLPKDPWNNLYQYSYPGQHSEIDIYSLGADGQPGGENENKDLGNWNL